MSLSEEVEEALLEALEEAGPHLPKTFVVRVPAGAFPEVYCSGGYRIGVIADGVIPNCELATESLSDWTARHERSERLIRETMSRPSGTPPLRRGKK